MELITRVVIHSLWVDHHIDWSYLGSCGAFFWGGGGIIDVRHMGGGKSGGGSG